jgi:hypothetical protein
MKYISNFININLKKSKEIREIISELTKMNINLGNAPKGPEEDIILRLKDKTGNNFISYSRYVCSKLSNQDINNLLELVEHDMKNNIIQQINILSKYEEINKNFEKSLEESIKNSYFDYSLINLVIFPQSNLDNYLKSMSKCHNLVKRYLFHGTQIEPISKILTTGFSLAKRAFCGFSIGFSDMLDYISFYRGDNNLESKSSFYGKTLPVNSTFSCVGVEVYYSKDKIKYVFDNGHNVDKLKEELKTNIINKNVSKNGVYITNFEVYKDNISNKEEITFLFKLSHIINLIIKYNRK